MTPETLAATHSKYFLYIAILFVAVLMISNTVAVKLIQIGPFIFSGGIFIFPISYIFGDILTEVYGYKASRKIIWSGFAALVLMSFCYFLVQLLPSPVFWQNQHAYEVILGAVPRIVLGSIVAYFAGEFSNSYVLSKMKVWMNGKHLWMRTIGSTIVGQALDSLIFYPLAFWSAEGFTHALVIKLLFTQWALKVAWEVLLTPVTYLVVGGLKRTEGVDVFDDGTDFSPFRAKV